MTSQPACQQQHSPQNCQRKTKISSCHMLAFLPHYRSSVTTSPRDSISTKQTLNMEIKHMYMSVPLSVNYWQQERGLAESLKWRNILHLLLLLFSAAENASPPSTWESSRGPGICHCVKETSPNPTQREKKKYSKVVQHLKPSPQLASLWSDRFPVSWPQPLQNTKSKMLKGFFVRTQKQFY